MKRQEEYRNLVARTGKLEHTRTPRLPYSKEHSTYLCVSYLLGACKLAISVDSQQDLSCRNLYLQYTYCHTCV